MTLRPWAMGVVAALGLAVLACEDDADHTAPRGDDADTGGVSFCDVVVEPVDANLPGVAGDGGPDLIVFLEPEASQSVIDVVGSALDEFGDLDVTYVDQMAAFEETRARVEDAELTADLRPEDLPASFRVHAEEREVLPQVTAGVEGLPGVREVVTAPDPDEGSAAAVPAGAVLVTLWYLNDRDVEVFLDPEVAETPPDELVGQAEQLGDRVLVLDQEATYEEFQRLFADSPQVLASVDPSILPPSVRFDVDGPIDVEALEARPGVRRVVTLPNAFESILVDSLVAEDEVAALIDELDDEAGDDLRALLDATRTWAGSDRGERTLGGVFDRDERRRLGAAALRVADRSVAECGIDVDITSGVAGD